MHLFTQLAALFRRSRTERFTGVYGVGAIRCHIDHADVPVSARTVRRLRLHGSDRVEFEISPRTGLARRVRCYRRAG